MNELGSSAPTPNANFSRGLGVQPQIQKSRGGGKKIIIWIIAALVIIGLAVAAFFLVPKFLQKSPVTGLAIGKGDMAKQDDGKFITSAELSKDDTLRIQMYYNPDKMTGTYVHIQDKNGKEVFGSTLYKLGSTKEFSLAMSIKTYEPGDYKISIQDQDKKEVATGTFKITG